MDTASLASTTPSIASKLAKPSVIPGSINVAKAKKKHSQRPQSFTTHSSRSSHSFGKGSTTSTTKKVLQTENQPQIVVKDEQGKDVTPVSLLSLKPSVLQQHTILMNSSATDTPVSADSAVDDFERSSSASLGKSLLSWSSRTVSESSTPRTSHGAGSTFIDSGAPSPRPTYAPGLALAEESAEHVQILPPTQIVTQKELHLNQLDIDRNVNLVLEETPTIWLLDIPGSCVEKDGSLAQEVIDRNENYKKMLTKRKVQSESFLDHGVQTLNYPPKTKEIQITPPKLKDSECIATDWDIFDSIEKKKVSSDDFGSSNFIPPEVDTLSDFDIEPGTWIDIDADVSKSKMKDSSELKGSLEISEKMIIQNVFHPKLLQYRGMKQTAREERFSDPALEFLWAYTCSITKGKSVSCMKWNPHNKDILAVGYGPLEYSKQDEGLVLCWSLKNPKVKQVSLHLMKQHPERVIRTSSGVTAIGFASSHPNLLAVGLYNGSILIFDLKHDTQIPALESGQTEFKHLDPIWEVQWIDRGDERGESLVSISSDGRVVQWSIKKGLEHAELMKLKRVANQAKLDKKNEAFVSRQAGGLCLDFCPSDTNVYLIGTEDGNIHKCSCSYNEQYLETYSSHSGPVYKIRWSPFSSGIFLSCSADWTMKLWDEEQSDSKARNPRIAFESVNSEVHDICWSPFSSTIFAVVNGSNKIEIWDLEISTLDPTVSIENPNVPVCVMFVEDSPALVVGDKSGCVNVYKLCHLRSEHQSTGSSASTNATKSPNIQCKLRRILSASK